jgi:hypothetical protein
MLPGLCLGAGIGHAQAPSVPTIGKPDWAGKVPNSRFRSGLGYLCHHLAAP